VVARDGDFDGEVIFRGPNRPTLGRTFAFEVTP
jgi:hypothetical protein